MNKCLVTLAAFTLSAASARGDKAALPTPVTAATPVPCPATASLELGQKRSVAFEMMERPVTRDLHFHYVPTKRSYAVDVTFDGPSADAAVIGLHYVFNPPSGLLQGIIARYGKPTTTPSETAAGIWDLRGCGERLRYKMQETKDHQPLQEEMWVEPLNGLKGVRAPVNTGGGSKKK